jgi:hypothetical protein
LWNAELTNCSYLVTKGVWRLGLHRYQIDEPECLLSRWIVKLERGDLDMCTALLRKKYLKERGFFSVNLSGGSQFWRGLHDIKYTCQQGLRCIMGNGKKIRFWLDVWLGECSLKIRFSRLFDIFEEQIWEVKGEGGGVNLAFRRRFGDRKILEWEEFKECLNTVQLSGQDTVCWALTKKWTIFSSFTV